MHYVAQVYVDDSATQYNTTNTSMDLDLPLSGGERIRVTVAVVTRCGQVSMPINSDVIVFVYTSVCESKLIIIVMPTAYQCTFYFKICVDHVTIEV